MKNIFILFGSFYVIFSCSNNSDKLIYKSKDLEDLNLFGNVQKVEIQSNKDEFEVIFFNEKGQKIKSINKGKKGSDSTKYLYTNDRLAKKIRYYDGKPISEKVCRYENGNLTEEKSYYIYEYSKDLEGYDLYKYDSIGNLIEMSIFDHLLAYLEDPSEIGLYSKTKYFYNLNNQLVLEKEYAHNGKVVDSIVYSYKNSGNKEIFEYDKRGNSVTFCKIIYDRYDNILYHSCPNEDYEVYFDYKDIDENGNWTTQYASLDDLQYSVSRKRKIKYYD